MKKMQKAKKILALLLIAVMLILNGSVIGCRKIIEGDKGAILTIYLAGDPANPNISLDPAKLIYSAEVVKFTGLIFEGLTVMDENGKLQKGMAKNWTIKENENKGEYIIEFEIKETKWSDGKPVTADDFVYAWKRILDPAFSSPAAPLLYWVKNARNVKEGKMTVDDLGVFALDTRLLQVTFDHRVDYDKFLENLSSVYLVPLRADTVDFLPEDWTKKPATLYSNGPFAIKQMEYSKITTLERSTYYLLPGKKGENIFKYVTPYKISLDFSKGAETLDAMTEIYKSGGKDNNYIFYLGNVPMAKYGEFKDKAVLKDLLSAYSYHFSTVVKAKIEDPKDPEKTIIVLKPHPLFSKAEVRRALSIALDRNKIAEIVGLGVKPATGIVPTGIIDVKSTGDDFRKAGRDLLGRDLINPAGDIAAARDLLKSAGVTGGSFKLKIKDTDVENAVALYAKEVWEQLGFTVTIDAIKSSQYGQDILFNLDKSETNFERGYEVIGYDDQAPGVDAFSVLAPFAKPFCGGYVTFKPFVTEEDEGFEAEPYITGFQDDKYDALMEEIVLIDNDNVERTKKLHEAEEKLFELSPVAPLFFNTSINITEKLTGLSYSKFGFTIFTKANLKNYLDYTVPVTEEQTAAPTE